MSAAGLAFVAARDAGAVARLASALSVPLDDATQARLASFAELVARWNARIDLTAARDAEQLCEVMFADALILAQQVDVGASDASSALARSTPSDTSGASSARAALVPRGARVLDVGSGAGAPALPLALLRPDMSLVLIEPLRKRVAFLRTVVGSIAGLAGRVEVREGKLDPAAPLVVGAPFDVAMARATFAPAVWLPLALRLARRALVLTAAESPPDAPTGAQRSTQTRYVLPRTAAPRVITAYDLR